MESKDEETALDSALYEDRLPRWRTSSQQRSRFIDALWVGLNASATIAIVFMNKLSVGLDRSTRAPADSLILFIASSPIRSCAKHKS